MDKTVKVILTILVIILFSIFSELFLRDTYGSLYIFVIAPLFWLVLAIFSKFFIFDNGKHIFEYKKFLTILLVTAGLFYIVIYFGLGIIISGFARSTYDTTLEGVIYNIWVYGLAIITMEMVRSSIVNANTTISERTMRIIVVILFSFVSFNYISMSKELSDIYGIVKFLGLTFMPTIILNSLLTSLTKYSGPLPGILYQIILGLSLWLAPILPAHKWVVVALMSSLMPFFVFLIMDNRIKTKELRLSKSVLQKSDPKKWIIRFVVIGALMLFLLGITPIYPLNIVTNSMYPKIDVGDVVLIQKVSIDKIEVGDIVQYQKESYTIVHRVVNISKKGGIICLYTKGDNNNTEDTTVTTYQNLLGKVVATVPKVGLPNIWIKDTLNKIDQSKATGN